MLNSGDVSEGKLRGLKMWLCLSCGITMTDDEADNQMAEYGTTAPCCCGGAMVEMCQETTDEDEIDYF